jgi:NAD(P)-dependent dehydrogenase (short-subunit alcohol dehydrogenase family)
MEHYVKDRVVIVTGGSSGFGLEAARLLLEMGAKVVITGRDAARLKKAEDDLGKSENLRAVRADAVKTPDWRRLIDTTVKTFGCLDVLVNNHGAGGKIAEVENMDDEDIRETLDVNLSSVIKGCREAVRAMKPRGKGLIVNVASACARHAWPSWGVYTAAKAGLVHFTRCLCVEMSKWGGRASSFIPGAARTNFCAAAGIDDSWLEGYPGAAEFARSLVHCLDLPDNCVMEELNIWGVRQIRDMMSAL